jgi:hypothetical protein
LMMAGLNYLFEAMLLSILPPYGALSCTVLAGLLIYVALAVRLMPDLVRHPLAQVMRRVSALVPG